MRNIQHIQIATLRKTFYRIKRFKRLQIRYSFQITLYSRMILKLYGYIIPTHFALYYDKIFEVERTLINMIFHYQKCNVLTTEYYEMSLDSAQYIFMIVCRHLFDQNTEVNKGCNQIIRMCLFITRDVQFVLIISAMCYKMYFSCCSMSQILSCSFGHNYPNLFSVRLQQN